MRLSKRAEGVPRSLHVISAMKLIELTADVSAIIHNVQVKKKKRMPVSGRGR